MRRKLAEGFFLFILVVSSQPLLFAQTADGSYHHAIKLFSAGDLEEAKNDFEVILKKKPRDEKTHWYLGVTLMRMGEESERRGDSASAVQQLQEAIQIDPNAAYSHLLFAKELYRQGDREEAMKECARAATLSPLDSDIAAGCGLGAEPPGKRETQDGPLPTTGFAAGKPFVPSPNTKPPRLVNQSIHAAIRRKRGRC